MRCLLSVLHSDDLICCTGFCYGDKADLGNGPPTGWTCYDCPVRHTRLWAGHAFREACLHGISHSHRQRQSLHVDLGSHDAADLTYNEITQLDHLQHVYQTVRRRAPGRYGRGGSGFMNLLKVARANPCVAWITLYVRCCSMPYAYAVGDVVPTSSIRTKWYNFEAYGRDQYLEFRHSVLSKYNPQTHLASIVNTYVELDTAFDSDRRQEMVDACVSYYADGLYPQRRAYTSLIANHERRTNLGLVG